MNAKQEILQRIRNAHQLAGTAPGPVEVPRHYRRKAEVSNEELKEMLVDRLVDYRAEVRHATEASLPQVLADELGALGATTVRYAEGLDPALFVQCSGDVAPDDRASDPRTLDAVDAVVTDSHVSAAETGTICLESNELCGRRALTLVPDCHVCIVRMSRVVYGVPEMIAALGRTNPVTMISGPSATSDIELNRVEGVHGPRTLVCIIVDDASA